MSVLPHVVVVDDEEDLREPVVDYLQSEGMDASGVGGGAELDAVMARRAVKLVVLDVNMPGEDGFSIARRLRAADPRLGLVMLTAKRDVIDRVVGLEIGADDYVTKPFEPRELLARLRAVLRRIGEGEARPAAEPEAPPHPAEPEHPYAEAIWVQTRGGSVRVGVDSIERIEAAKDYVLLHTAERAHMLRITMGALEAKLDPAHLVRVHRSAFVRPDAVVEVRRPAGGAVSVRLKSGVEVPVGPNHLAALEAQLDRP